MHESKALLNPTKNVTFAMGDLVLLKNHSSTGKFSPKYRVSKVFPQNAFSLISLDGKTTRQSNGRFLKTYYQALVGEGCGDALR